jgi:hypothetical protein
LADKILTTVLGAAAFLIAGALIIAVVRVVRDNRAELKRLVFSWRYGVVVLALAGYAYMRRDSPGFVLWLLLIPVITAQWLRTRSRSHVRESPWSGTAQASGESEMGVSGCDVIAVFQTRRKRFVWYTLVPFGLAASLVFLSDFTALASQWKTIGLLLGAVVGASGLVTGFFIYRCPVCNQIAADGVLSSPRSCNGCGARLS